MKMSTHFTAIEAVLWIIRNKFNILKRFPSTGINEVVVLHVILICTLKK